jgi:predicted nuclease with TOPRIM domain
MENHFAETEKLKSLIKQMTFMYEQKKALINILVKENQDLKDALSQKSNEVQQLEGRYDTIKTAKAISLSEEDKHSVKEKINRIVREIDKSIGLLNA